jgi:hypothetical protein
MRFALFLLVFAIVTTSASAQFNPGRFGSPDPYGGVMRDMQQWQRDYEYQRQDHEYRRQLEEQRELNEERRHRERMRELRRQREED